MSKYLDYHDGVRVTADTRHVREGVRIAWLEDSPYAIVSLHDDDDRHILSHATIDLTELADLHDKVGQLLDRINNTTTGPADPQEEVSQ
jgi:hypothetical protein